MKVAKTTPRNASWVMYLSLRTVELANLCNLSLQRQLLTAPQLPNTVMLLSIRTTETLLGEISHWTDNHPIAQLTGLKSLFIRLQVDPHVPSLGSTLSTFLSHMPPTHISSLEIIYDFRDCPQPVFGDDRVAEWRCLDDVDRALQPPHFPDLREVCICFAELQHEDMAYIYFAEALPFFLLRSRGILRFRVNQRAGDEPADNRWIEISQDEEQAQVREEETRRIGTVSEVSNPTLIKGFNHTISEGVDRRSCNYPGLFTPLLSTVPDASSLES